MGTSACGSGGPAALAGTLSLDEALSRLLSGAPCTWRIVDPRTVRISPPAPAAPQDPVRAPALVAELMVTATKRPTSVGRIPAGASAIAQDQLELTGATDIGRTTSQLAGVITTNLGPGRDKLLIRGLSDGAFTGRARSTVSTYLDDAPINFNAPDPDLRLTDVAQVEVVRGPQGALYGSGALTGIYRVVTNKPDLREMHAGMAGTLAWTDDGSPSRVIEGYANLPLSVDRAAVRAVAYHDIQGGYLDNAMLGENNVDRTVRDGGRLAFRFQLSDAWQADLSAAGQRLRSNDSQYVSQGMGQNRGNRVQEAHKNDFGVGAFNLRGELPWASLTSSLTYVQHTYSSLYDATPVAVRGGAFQNLGGDLGVFHETARVAMWVEDFVLRSSRPGPVAWLVGAYATSAIEKTPSTIGVRTPGALHTAYRENRRDRVREIALYGEASYAFGDGWTAAAGGRLFETRVNTLSDVTVAAPGASRGFEGERRFSDFSPAMSLQKEFAGGELVYLLYSEGFRNGGFNTGGIYQIRSTRLTFAPDRLRNYEAGAKLRLLDQRLSARSAVFYDRWSNLQSDQYRPSGVAFTGNAGDARILGFEAEAAYDFDFGLQLQANLLLADSDMTETNPNFSDTPLVNALPGVPDVSGGVLAVYERPLDSGLTLRLSGEAAYVGESTVSFLSVRAYAQEDYVKARLAAELYAKRWSAMIFVTNPADSAGDTFAYGNPFIYGAEGRLVTPQRPRTLGVRLAADF